MDTSFVVSPLICEEKHKRKHPSEADDDGLERSDYAPKIDAGE